MHDIIDVIEDAEVLLCKGIKEISSKDELDTNSLGVLAEAIDTVEDIYKIKMYKDIENGEYDSPDRGYSYGYNERKMYPDYMVRGSFVPIGNSGYVRNDGRSNNTDSSYRNNYGRPYDRGYSRGSVIEHLEHALKDADNESDRQEIRRMISDIERR